ncbi:phospholemman isoform X2 [Rattus norvegicus]|uniref:phospholemman isoform X2 n=1 Tax=Rattus norvegicus TaxID=10116 RepID=UPI0019176844|nr:phospholemman isoform X2 [Rattus norvegicus]
MGGRYLYPGSGRERAGGRGQENWDCLSTERPLAEGNGISRPHPDCLCVSPLHGQCRSSAGTRSIHLRQKMPVQIQPTAENWGTRRRGGNFPQLHPPSVHPQAVEPPPGSRKLSQSPLGT